jgi:phosphate transporter
MKFGKELKESSIHGWEEYYMSYKRLKRVIKKIIVQIKERKSAEEQMDLSEAVDASESESSSDEESLRSASLSNALRLPDRIDAEQFALNEEKIQLREKSSKNQNSPELSRSTALSRESSANESAKQKKRNWSTALIADDANQQFFHLFQEDLDKINAFFGDKLSELISRYHWLSHKEQWNQQEMDNKNTSGKEFQNEEKNENTNKSAESIENRSTSLLSSVSSSYGSTDDKRSHGDSLNDLPSLTRSAHTITVSQAKQLEHRSNAVLTLYRHCLQLNSYRSVNRKGFEKILKKFDKYAVEKEKDKMKLKMMEKVDQNSFITRGEELNGISRRTEELFLKICISRGLDAKIARNLLKAVDKDVEFNVDLEGIHDENAVVNRSIFHISSNSSQLWILLAIALFAAVLHAPILQEFPRAHSCLALLAAITVLWTTEAVPYFVSALVIPISVVLLQILVDDKGNPLNAEKASKMAFGSMYSDATILIISSFALSTAFSKSSYELRIAAMIQRLTGHRPYLFLLSYMLLSAFLSFFISNIAAPVLLTSILEPHLRDFQRTNSYAKSLLLGLAFASNIGGLMSPISSPENSIILGYVEDRYPTHLIGFTQWLAMSVPFALIAIFAIWAYLCFVLLRNSDDTPPFIPSLAIGAIPWRKQDFIILATTLITVLLLYSLTYTREFFGSMSTVALIPILIYFGTGILNKKDLSLFNWQLILLIGGGNVLGAAIQSSKLLNIMSELLLPFVSHERVHLAALAVMAIGFLVTSVVSRTVAAIILTPIILNLGSTLHHDHLFVMVIACTINSTMSLPMTSFPNINSLLIADDFGRPFLHAMDFVRHGISSSLIVLALLSTIGYSLIRMAFDKPIGLWIDPVEAVTGMSGYERSFTAE